MPQYIKGSGSLEPKLVIVLDAPDKSAAASGLVASGVVGDTISDFLFKAGMNRNDVYITYAVKYQPPMNDFKKYNLIGINVESEIKDLWDNEIRILKPNCILALGNEALKAVAGVDGILDYRGSILRANDNSTKVVASIAPSALFSSVSGDENEYKGALEWTWSKIIQADVIRAVEESASPVIDLPHRDLTIAHNSLDLYRYFREYEKLDLAACDIESINCVPVCVGFAFNKHHAISIPLLKKIGSAHLTDMGDNELDECWKIIDKQLRRLRLIGHNFKYDDFKLSLVGFECPNVYSDTLIKTRVIFPELPDKRLCTVSSIWTREPFYKDDGKEFKLGKSKIDQLLIYNGRDCAVEFEVDEAQEVDLIAMEEQFKVPLQQYYRTQMRKHKLYLKFETNGKLVDLEKQKELKKKYTEMQFNVHNRLVDKIGHDVNVKSGPQVFSLLYKEMKFKERKKAPTSEDVIVSLMAQTKKKEYKEILQDLLEERRIRDQKSRQINFSPDYDGRCKSSYNIISTETCRSSTGILNKPLRPKKIGLADHTISAHGRLAKDIKTMFIKDPGKVIIQIDSAQAEARVVAVLSEDWELLEAFDKIDIHRRGAGLLFGYTQKLELSADFKHPILDNLPKDGPERFTGKKTRHAGNYNMGKHRFMTEFNTDAQKFEIPMTISEWRAGQMLDLFHNASPKIRGKFHVDIQDAITSTRVLIDPFGGVRVFNGRMDDRLFGEAYANIPQRTVSHLVQGAALTAEAEFQDDNQFMWTMEKHDALFFQAPENDWERYAKFVQGLMQTPIDFSTYCTLKRDVRLVIPGDVEVSHSNYAEFKKVKF